MKARIFAELPEFKDMTVAKLKVGDRFLTGTTVISQKELKTIGDMVTYYMVTEVSENGKNISYRPIYDRLEE